MQARYLAYHGLSARLRQLQHEHYEHLRHYQYAAVLCGSMVALHREHPLLFQCVLSVRPPLILYGRYGRPLLFLCEHRPLRLSGLNEHLLLYRREHYGRLPHLPHVPNERLLRLQHEQSGHRLLY